MADETYFKLSEYGQDALVAGVDEVGRGALFGPVVAAAVVLPLSQLPKLQEIGVRDSKQLSPQKRQKLIEPIKAIASGSHVSYSTVEEIDKINILQASLLAMKRAVLALNPVPDICLVDGKFSIPDLALPQKTIIQGDRQSLVIGAASILAKVWRDNLIIDLASQYPEYDLAANKGYPTKKHRLAIQKYGVVIHHRKSFSLKSK
ncbi:ribonuclease HII [Xenococcus sp. PCC 7305]|uniref:ribonuclease HII n=1 Tax=Xenococcus sp. PCC 7305 TaxID=102125 RepID=UPI0002AD175C|nr:ribonuclease HII [Xenococcus sp. PCC 7305]